MPPSAGGSITIAKQPQSPSTVDIEVKIIQGRNLVNHHHIRTPSFLVEMELDHAGKKRTSVGPKGDRSPLWNTTFVFPANLSSSLRIRVYCHHDKARYEHPIGEVTLCVLKATRNENIDIAVHNTEKSGEKKISGYLILQLKVSTSVIFEIPDMGMQLMGRHDVIEFISSAQLQKLSPAWKRFLPSFLLVVTQAQNIASVDKRAQVAVAVVSSAIKIVADQIERDDKIEKLIETVGDLYAYFLDANPFKKILLFEKKVERLLTETTECAYFISGYQRLRSFTERALVNIISDADTKIADFEAAFGEIKIDLILGSSLQTVLDSDRILRKVENIEYLTYLNQLPYLKSTGWESARVCLRGTCEVIIREVIQWVSNTAVSPQGSRLYMLSGPPGCGKSAIAHTVSEIFHHQRRLGAVVILRNDQAVNLQQISSTIAFQLANFDPAIKEQMAKKIMDDGSLASADIQRQFLELISPAVKAVEIIRPILIVIDGHLNPEELYQLLTAIIPSLSYLPPNIRVLVTSRIITQNADLPEQTSVFQIRNIGFDDAGDGSLSIQEYASACLDHIFVTHPKLHEKYTITQLHQEFLSRSFRIHFWIKTAYHFLLESSVDDQLLILDRILESALPLSKEQSMDHLYRAILHIPSSLRQSPHSLFLSLIMSPRPESFLSTIFPGMIGTIFIQKSCDEHGTPLFSVHPSMEDFMSDQQRCKDIPCSVVAQHFQPYTLGELCLDEMNRLLKYNICDLNDLMALNRGTSDENHPCQLKQSSLEYACCNWISHLSIPAFPTEVALQKIQDFLSNHLLHWIEFMSLHGFFSLVIPSLERLKVWLKGRVTDDDERVILTIDSIQFIRSFGGIISSAPLHAYISALPLMPSDTLFFKIYHKTRLPNRYDLKSDFLIAPASWKTLPPPSNWNTVSLDASACTFSGHILFQYQQRVEPSGIWLYDISTGCKVGIIPTTIPRIPLWRCYRIFLATSRDGQRHAIIPSMEHGVPMSRRRAIPASGPVSRRHRSDQSSKNPNPKASEEDLSLEPVRGYIIDVKLGISHTFCHGGSTDPVRAQTFSDDGSRLLTIDNSYKIQVWEATTAACVRSFEFGQVVVALSPNGRLLAVPMGKWVSPMGIQLFNVDSGKKEDKFELNGGADERVVRFGGVSKIGWSPDGRFLAAVGGLGHSNKIILWRMDGRIILCLDTPERASCLAFSPDSNCLVAYASHYGNEYGSVWDTSTGHLLWSKFAQFGRYVAHLSPMGWSATFTRNSDEIIFYDRDDPLGRPPVRLVKCLPTYMFNPQIFSEHHPVPTIQYTRLTSKTRIEFASQVDSDGWIVTTEGEREIMIPYQNFELSSKDRAEADDERVKFSQRTTLEVKHPESKAVVLRYKIDFELKE